MERRVTECGDESESGDEHRHGRARGRRERFGGIHVVVTGGFRWTRRARASEEASIRFEFECARPDRLTTTETTETTATTQDALVFGDGEDEEEVSKPRTPAWIAVGRPRRPRSADENRDGDGDGGTTTTTRDDEIEGLRRENAELRARLRAMEHEFDAQWRTEMKSVREAVVERDAEWSKRVDRYRRAANDARADRDADRAAWAVERASLRDDRAIRASSASIERLRRDVRALKRSCRDLRSSAELAKRLVGPAVERALEGVRRAFGDA